MMARGRVALVLLLLWGAAPLAAQRQLRDPGARTTLHGVVVDRVNGDPLPNAIVLLADEGRGLLTDSLGRFTFDEVRLGPQLLAVKQYGYAEINLDLDLLEGHGPVRVELRPGPLALEGFTIVAENLASMTGQLARRRNAYAGSARALDQTRLAMSTERNVLQLLQTQGGLHLRRCAGGRNSPATSFRPIASVATRGPCVARRGSTVQPRVYIDEAPIVGGLGFLAMFRPYELYLVEVFSAGLEIRAYTHWYMERMAARPGKLFPLGF